MRCLPLLLALALVPAAAATDLLVDIPSDAGFGRILLSTRASLAFLDADGDSKPDWDPDEPVYLDTDRSASINLGDLRLSAYPGLPAASEIRLADADLAKPLVLLGGWLALDGKAWIADTDNSGTLSAGDVRLTGAPGLKARAGDADLGHPLKFPSDFLAPGAILVDDANRNGRRDVAEPILLDLDAGYAGGNQVSKGDILFQPIPALALNATPAPAPSPPVVPATAGTSAKAPEGGLRTLDGVLLALAVLNLAGLLFVVRAVTQLRGPPKNPFN